MRATPRPGSGAAKGLYRQQDLEPTALGGTEGFARETAELAHRERHDSLERVGARMRSGDEPARNAGGTADGLGDALTQGDDPNRGAGKQGVARCAGSQAEAVCLQAGELYTTGWRRSGQSDQGRRER